MKQIHDNIYVTRNTAVVFGAKEKGLPQHSQPKLQPSSSDSEAWCNWGDDNLYPKRLMEKIGKVGAATGGLEILTSAHFGMGIRIYELYETEGDAVFREKIPSAVPEIYDFFDATQFDLVVSDLISDYETLGIAFPEYLLSPNGEQIISVTRHKAADCRFEKPKNGMIQNVIINTAWGETEFKKEDNIAVPCFSQYLSAEEIKAYCKEKNIRKFIVPVLTKAKDSYPFFEGKVQVNHKDTILKLNLIAGHIKATAKRLGINIVWGGDWRKPYDPPHFQL